MSRYIKNVHVVNLMMSISRSYPGNIYLSGTTFMPGVSFSSSALPVFLHHHIIDKIKKSVWQPAFQPKRSPWLPPRLATESSCKQLFLPTSTIKMIVSMAKMSMVKMTKVKMASWHCQWIWCKWWWCFHWPDGWIGFPCDQLCHAVIHLPWWGRPPTDRNSWLLQIITMIDNHTSHNLVKLVTKQRSKKEPEVRFILNSDIKWTK